MAGLYPDAPSWLMPLDRDGSTVFAIPAGGVITQATSGQVQAIQNQNNDEWDPLDFVAGDQYVGVVFPELRDIDAFHLNAYSFSGALTADFQVSADTTNGQDGTWTAIGSPVALPVGLGASAGAVPAFRTGITSVTALAKRGFRVHVSVASSKIVVRTLNLYGEPAPGANPDRLELWHPTNDEKLPPAYFDWGNVPRSSSADLPFRVKNLSASLTAGDVRVAMEALTDGSPSVPGQHTVSHNGGSFLAQVNIGDLAPGAISLAVTLRRVMASNAQLGLFRMRVFAESTDWS